MEEKNVLVSGKYFRVCPITKVDGVDSKMHTPKFRHCPLKNGLAIEKKYKKQFDGHEDETTYFVIGFVRPRKYKGLIAIEFEDVCFRTITMIEEGTSPEDLWEMIQEYKNCVEFAQDTMMDIFAEGER